MSLRTLLTGKAEIVVNGGTFTGKIFERESATVPFGFAVDVGDNFIIGCGTTHKEAIENARKAAMKPRTNNAVTVYKSEV